MHDQELGVDKVEALVLEGQSRGITGFEGYVFQTQLGSVSARAFELRFLEIDTNDRA